MSHLHPALVLFVTAFFGAICRGRLRQIILLAGAVAALLTQLGLSAPVGWSFSLPHYALHPFAVDPLSQVFGLIFTLITCLGVLYALHSARGGEPVVALVYAGTALGVVYAGDWLTLFAFWELMAVASLFVIWYGGTAASRAAGFRYLLVHICGGSLLLCGILVHVASGAGLTLQALTTLPDASPVAFWLILLGIALNAAMPPLHAWMTDAYPEASVTGSVFLSAFTTKTAVYVLVRIFPGAEVLVWTGVAMALYGVVYAVLENDIRRLLAYHIVSQVGYMVAGVGIGSTLALDGAVAHAFCHILYKALLFMGAGAVIYTTGKRKLTELGGIGQHMWLVVGLYMVGAFSISGVPLFNGFISKSMILSAAAEAHRPVTELLLTLASVGTFLSIGLKLPYFTFFHQAYGAQPQPVPRHMLLAMSASGLLCLALGIFPAWLYARLPFAATYHPYTVDHVVAALQLLFGTGLGFWWVLPQLRPKPTTSLDTDWLYRKPLVQGCQAVIAIARHTGETLETWRTTLLRVLLPSFQTLSHLRQLHLGSRSRLPVTNDIPTSRLPIGVTVFWIIVLFAAIALYAR